jgi:hypothetical protein
VLIDEKAVPGMAKEFLTVQTLFTATGATTAVFTVSTVLRSLTSKLDPRWMALVISLTIMIVGIGVQKQSYGDAPTVLAAVINSFVVYAAAVGVNNVTTNPRPQVGNGGGGAAPAAVPGAGVAADAGGVQVENRHRVRWFA